MRHRRLSRDEEAAMARALRDELNPLTHPALFRGRGTDISSPFAVARAMFLALTAVPVAPNVVH